MHTSQLLSDGFDEKRGNDRRVDAAGQSQQYFFVADLFAKSFALLIDKGFRQRGGRDALHGFGSYVVSHFSPPI